MDDSEFITHILFYLNEVCQTIAENIEDKLDNDNNPITIDINRGNILMKYDRMNKQPIPITPREDEKPLLKIPIQGYLYDLWEIRA